MIDLTEVQELKERLDRLSDQVNQRIQAWEVKFRAMGLGVRCWTPLKPEGSLQLGYSNEQGEWKILVKETDPRHKNESYIWDLKTAPRGMRVWGLKNMDLLEQATFETGKSLAERMEKVLMGRDKE